MIGRASIKISTGKLIEFQSGNPNPETMIQNAITVGIVNSDIEIRDIADQQEFNALMPTTPPPATTQLEQDIAVILDPQMKSILERLRKGVLL